VIHKTKSAIHSLKKATPSMAMVVNPNGSLIQRSVKQIPVGASIQVRKGETIPLDGVVTVGDAEINFAALTGESAPVPKQTGEEVPAGSTIIDGSLTIKVTKTSADSTISRMIQLIIEASSKKPKVQRFLDRFGEIYSTAIILIALFFAISLPVILSIPILGMEGSIYRSLAFLIAASPCALIIATPTAYLSAISACAKRGILLKGGLSLDAIANTNTFVFDKTGTLTTGLLQLKDIEIVPLKGEASVTLDEAITIAAAMEKVTSHPISDAIIHRAGQIEQPLVETKRVIATPGKGIEAEISTGSVRCKCYIGSLNYIHEICPSEIAKEVIHQHVREDQAIACLKVDQTLIFFHFLDEIRPNVYQLVENLTSHNNSTSILLTGDHQLNAHSVAGKVGIKKENVYHNLKPEEKLSKIEELSQHAYIAMVGDGINDAPAMARAHVSIAMGYIGTATAIDAADIVLLRDELSDISWLVKKAKKTMRIVRENLSLALLVILLATTPSVLGYIPLWLAVILHEGGTVLVGLNSLRLLRHK
jgi:Zn2+/Cd2+-exporting ATPase